MKSREETVDFIKLDLVPEMAHNRCFCDAGSREFVELESTDVEHVDVWQGFPGTCDAYRVRTVLRFSGEPRVFSLLVKLLKDDGDSQKCFEAFQNEEMFYTKMAAKYGTDYAPKCYLADLGRYGRPVIVLDDLQAGGHVRVDNKLDAEQLELCVKLLAKFHGRGLKLKSEEFSVFREFYAKLLEITFFAESVRHYEQRSRRIADTLSALSDAKLAAKVKNKLGECPLSFAKAQATEANDVSTVCHGHFSRDNLLFKYENDKPIDVKVIDWQTMRYCSPAIDLGLILFSNITHGSQLSKVEEILTLYVDTVKCEYPEVPAARLREDIVSKLLSACLLTYFHGDLTDEELLQVVSQLEPLNAFD